VDEMMHDALKEKEQAISSRGLSGAVTNMIRGDMMMNNNLNINLGSMVSLNSINNK
jgi:hypothetical protein